MSNHSFIGGIHPPHNKHHSEHQAVVTAEQPKIVRIPLRQHIGAPSDAIVAKGEHVKVGQKIGEASSFVSAPVHSSVSGIVKDILKVTTAGGPELCIVIESDGQDQLHETVVPKGTVDELSSKEIMAIIKEAGIVGMGGAGFPTHVKLSPPPEKKMDTVILNGAECEPYLTADHRLMLETPEKVVVGLLALMKALQVSKGFIGIEDNKPDAVMTMKKAAEPYADRVQVIGLHTKYPQGAEKQLIYACTKREVPSGGLPMECGVVVNNVATAAAIYDAIYLGMPLIERICTVTGGAIKEPKNLKIKVGVSLQEIIDQCGGYKETPRKMILGGPMMGLSVFNEDVPATKTTSGILMLTEAEAKLPESENCMKCGKCVSTCPAYLQPLYISAYALLNQMDMSEKFKAMDCIECGSCSYICPSKRPLLQSIRLAKREILANRRKSK
jgi:electron transport complex protein RnfC